MTDPCAVPRQSVVLLGASNLTIGWRPLMKVVTEKTSRPLEILAAIGLGRSFVGWSYVGLRGLPAIPDCGLWRSLPGNDSPPPLVFVTDLGNDIVYGHRPEAIMQHVSACIHRIFEWRPDSKIVLSGLPLESVRSMNRWRFLAARTMLFPGCFLSFDTILGRSEELDTLAADFAVRMKIPRVVPEGCWYGVDPIHVLRPLREEAFRRFLSHWPEPEAPGSAAAANDLLRMPAPIAAERRTLRFTRHTAQPVYASPMAVVSSW